MNTKNPTALIILDGWGWAEDSAVNAITQAQPQTFNYLWDTYPHALLQASGAAVGLPDNAPGNSEVGHLTIGAGRIIQQPITRINNAMHDGSFFSNQQLLHILQTCKKKNGRLHLLGLLSDGLVHSNCEHLYALIQAAAREGIAHVYVHAFLDGRDVAPHSSEKYITELKEVFKKNKVGELGSLSGRFYAMDRNENWERTCAVYNMLTGIPCVASDTSNVFPETSSEEFMKPTLLSEAARIQDNDTLIFFNIRPDRMRQLFSFFTHIQLPSQKNTSCSLPQVPHNLTIASMVKYHQLFTQTVLFEQEKVTQTLLDSLEKDKKTIFTIAETEKYAHITYFFSGGKETQRSNETRVLIPSPDVATYDQQPEMSAPTITQTVLESLHTQPCDFYLINYANADMVGHTGNFEKTKEAVACLDEQLKMLYVAFVHQNHGTLYITSDHGKAEQMVDSQTRKPKTAHTCNPVPFIMVNNTAHTSQKLPLKELADIAPFILKNMGIRNA